MLLGLSQIDLASILEVEINAISLWELARVWPSGKALLKIQAWLTETNTTDG
jgi:transcriptional regulator with XRE-family HTH domain